VVKRLCGTGRNPLLLITGLTVPQSAASERYGAFLRQSLPPELLSHVVFVNDFFPIHDDTLRDLFLLSDCLFFPSKQEGFGLPIVEAARYRLPVWCANGPAFQLMSSQGGAYLIDDISRLSDAVIWLENQATFRQQRHARQVFDPTVIYRQYYEPLLASFIPASVAG